MQTKIIEAVQPGTPQNWGKFMLMRPGVEWQRRSAVSDLTVNPALLAMLGWEPEHIHYRSLLAAIGWGPRHVIVFDLQTCEGAAFLPGGRAKADLDKHRIHVCPLFEPFLEWLYQQDLTELAKLPDSVEIEAEFEMAGYRRLGLDLVGLTEIGQMRGFSKSRAGQLSMDPDFPAPAIVLAMGPAWYRHEIKEFFVRRYPDAGIRIESTEAKSS